ncbi:MAG: winged helix-turn-helix domain-containing protein [archaeon]
MDIPWEIIGKLKASSYRREILGLLLDAEMTPKEIAKKLNFKFSHVSRSLRELMDMGLVECLTPDLHIGKIYRATEKGKKAYGSISKK